MRNSAGRARGRNGVARRPRRAAGAAGRARRGTARGSRSAALTVAALAAAGCADGPGNAVTVADSAGVRIVTNLPGGVESAERWSLPAGPAVEIGAGASPEVALHQVTAVSPLGGRRVAVGTLSPPQVRVLDADGGLEATLGREGDGPGEFASVGSVVPLPGDSLAVWDPDRRRVSVFTGAGQFARDLDLSDLAPLSARAAPSSTVASGTTHLLPSTSGTFVLFAEGAFGPDAGSGVHRTELPARRIGPGGEELASFGRFPGMTTTAEGPLGTVPLPLGARTYAVTSDDRLVVGTAETPELRVFGPDGRLARIVRWPDRERAVAGAFLDRWSDLVADRPELREAVEALPLPQRFPAYEGLVATDGGEILVGDYAGPLGVWPLRRADHGPQMMRPRLRVPARRWLVLDPDGALVATLVTPEGFEPAAVREGLMWGVHTDELDVESVRAYEVSR